MPKKKQPGVIILGGHVQGLGILRILGKKGIPGILIDNTNINIARHSKYCRKFYRVVDNNLLEFLFSPNINKKYFNWLIFPTNDFHVKLLSQNKTALEQYFKVSTPCWEVVEPFYNKRLTYKLAQKINVSIPKTWMPVSLEEIKHNEIEYPCIVKPAVMFEFYKKTGKKVFLCKNQEELITNYDKALEIIPANEIIIQEVIPGDSNHQYSACFVFNGEKPLVTLVARRARQHPPDFGNATTSAETVDIPELIDYSIKLLKSINYKGICEVEFKYDQRENKYKLLEVNPRTWKWHYIAEKSDSPLLMSLYNYIYNLDPIEKNNFIYASYRHFITDVPVIFLMKIMGINIKKIKKNRIYAVWDIKDFKPAIFELLYLPYLIIKR